VDEAFVQAVVSRRVLISPTLIVGANYREALSGGVTLEDFERKCAPANTAASFDRLPSLKILGKRPDALPVQKRNLKRLADAGAIIYASSDAGNTRTLHGPSLHRELAVMADAGLRPMDILVAATRTNARLMGREHELGQIAPEMLADVLLLDANPLTDIRHTRRVSQVIRGGQLFQH
jgi:imidazolonepropionase-like amidohydrolase